MCELCITQPKSPVEDPDSLAKEMGSVMGFEAALRRYGPRFEASAQERADIFTFDALKELVDKIDLTLFPANLKIKLQKPMDAPFMFFPPPRAGAYVRFEMEVKDRTNPSNIQPLGNGGFIPLPINSKLFLEFMRMGFLAILQHEFHEALMVKGERIWDPHGPTARP